MSYIAVSVPKVSGVSGCVRSIEAHTGQQKINKIKQMNESVRRVRRDIYSPINARACVKQKNNIKNLLGTFNKTGQTGQSLKAFGFVTVFMSGCTKLHRTLTGQAGQTTQAGPSTALRQAGYSHRVFCAVWTFLGFRNFGKLFDFGQLLILV